MNRSRAIALALLTASMFGCSDDAGEAPTGQPEATPAEPEGMPLEPEVQNFKDVFEKEYGPIKPRDPDEPFHYDLNPPAAAPFPAVEAPKAPPAPAPPPKISKRRATPVSLSGKKPAAAQSVADEAKEIELMLRSGKPKSVCETLCCF